MHDYNIILGVIKNFGSVKSVMTLYKNVTGSDGAGLH